MLRRRLTCVAIGLAAIATMAVPAAAQDPARACTAGELAGTRTPVVVEEDSADGYETSTLATGKAYRRQCDPRVRAET